MSAPQRFTVAVKSPARSWFGAPGLSNGLFRSTVYGDASPDYCNLGSTNLVDWEAIRTNHSATPPFGFTNAADTNFNRRFYRVRLGP